MLPFTITGADFTVLYVKQHDGVKCTSDSTLWGDVGLLVPTHLQAFCHLLLRGHCHMLCPTPWPLPWPLVVVSYSILHRKVCKMVRVFEYSWHLLMIHSGSTLMQLASITKHLGEHCVTFTWRLSCGYSEALKQLVSFTFPWKHLSHWLTKQLREATTWSNYVRPSCEVIRWSCGYVKV